MPFDPDREISKFEAHPFWSGFKWLLGIVGIIMVIAVVGGIGHFVLGWFNAGAEIVSPANVKEQYGRVIEDWNSLEAAAQNACGAEDAAKHGNVGPTLLEDPALAYKAKYRQIAVDYNRRQTNIFEAKLVGPSNCGAQDCPRLAPTLGEMQKKVC